MSKITSVFTQVMKEKRHRHITYESEEAALNDFRTINIMKWALIESSALICTVFGFINGHMYLMILAAIFLSFNGLNENDYHSNYNIKTK